jgi:hypothetical protein
VGTDIKEIDLVVYKSCDFSDNCCRLEQFGKKIQWAVTGNETRNSEQVVGPASPPSLSVDLTFRTGIAPTPISRLEE